MQDPSASKAKKMKKTTKPKAASPSIIQNTKYSQTKQTATPPKKTKKVSPSLTGSGSTKKVSPSLTCSGSTEDYRVLRRQYLLLEEESFSLDKDLDQAEAETRVLQQQKNALLDELVVLEGLVDPPQAGSRHAGRI